LLDQCDEQLLLGADVVVERRTVDADLRGDVFEAGAAEPLTTEDLPGALEDGLPTLAGGPAVGIAPLVPATGVVALLAGGRNLSSSLCVLRVNNLRHQGRELRKDTLINVNVDVDKTRFGAVACRLMQRHRRPDFSLAARRPSRMNVYVDSRRPM
jgi:hypothetical protein